jgi:hypothetical protein
MGTPAAALLAVVGILSPLNGDPATLGRLDPVSLRPEGPRVGLGEYHDAWSFSPDGSRLALGMGGARRTCGRGICLVDVRDMAISGDVEAPIAIEALAWPRPRRIVGVLQAGGIVVADPLTGTIVRRTPLPYRTRFAEWERTPGGLALLMNGPPLRLVAVDASGTARDAPLDRIRPAENGYPGLAVDRRGRRALVVAAGAPVAEVDLRTMRVRYHRVRFARSPRARRTTGRDALWLGNGLMAVSGEGPTGRPEGVHVVDTRTWTARTVEARASRVRLAAGRLLVYTAEVFRPRAAGVGLRIYTRDGRRMVSHLFGSQSFDVEVAGARAYAYRIDGRRRALHVIQARTGRILRTRAAPPRRYDVDILGAR